MENNSGDLEVGSRGFFGRSILRLRQFGILNNKIKKSGKNLA